VLAEVSNLPAVLPWEGPSPSLIDQIVREGARTMLAAALQAEVGVYIDQFADVRDENGHAGLSASTIIRLTETWTAEAAAFASRDLSGVDYVYLWIDGPTWASARARASCAC